MSNLLKKRDAVWVYSPQEYGMRCDRCKGDKIAWSEYEEHVWCYTCKLDTSGEGWPLDLAGWYTSKLIVGQFCHHKIRIADLVLLELVNSEWQVCKDHKIENGKIVEVPK